MPKTAPREQKKDPTSDMDDGSAIAKLMAVFYRALMEDAFADAAERGVSVVWDIHNPITQARLAQLAKNIKSVPETTKDNVRRLTDRANEEGWSSEQLAKAILEKGEIDSRYRATMIARTETGTAYNLGSIDAYRIGGVTHVDVLDGDDDEPCASANGSRWTLEEAEANPLGHPNCTRAFSPVVES
jgi:hypothetical protein